MTYEEMNQDQRKGWEHAVCAFLYDERLDDMEETDIDSREGFMKVFREILCPEMSEDFYTGAHIGLVAEFGPDDIVK